jgi:hypothetical protein
MLRCWLEVTPTGLRRSLGRSRKCPKSQFWSPGALIRRAPPLDNGLPGGSGTRCSGMVKCGRGSVYH